MTTTTAPLPDIEWADVLEARRPISEVIASWNENDWKALAFHEAGHAVAAVVLGISITRVSIVPSIHSFGRVTHGRHEPYAALVEGAPLNERGRQAVRAQVLMSFAGPSAEERLTGWCRSTDNDGYEQAQMLELLGGSDSEILAELLNLSDVSRQFVEEHWEVIGQLAEVLFDRRMLSGKTVRKIVRRALGAQRVAGEVGSG